MAKKKKDSFKRNSLTSKIVGLTVFLDALFLVIILAGAVFLYYYKLNQERVDTAEFQSQMIYERYSEIFDDIRIDVSLLSVDQEIVDYLNYVNEDNQPIITDEEDPNYQIYTDFIFKTSTIMSYQEDDLFDLVYVATATECSAGADGCAIAYNGELSNENWSLAERPWYIALGESNSILTEPYVDALSGEYVISYIEKVYDDTLLIGYVGVDIALDKLATIFDSIYQEVLGASNEIIMISKLTTNPVLIYLSTDDFADYYLADSTNMASIDIAKGYNGSGVSFLINSYVEEGSINVSALNNRFIVNYTDLPESNFTVISMYYIENLFGMEIMFLILIGVAGILIFLIGTVMHGSVKKSLDPIDDILESIEEIKNGNYDVHISIKENNELRQIGHAINIMSEEINRQIQRTYDTLAYDFLTGLKNRASASAEIDETVFKADTRSAVCLIQVDNLKNINVTKGQIIGDNLIKAIAEELKKVFKNNATLFSNGGNEFVYIKEKINSLEEVEFALNRLLTL